MATGASKFLVLFLLSLLTVCSSGTLVGFSYHARRTTASSSPSKTISFLKLNKVSPSQIRVFVADHQVLSTLSNSGVSVDLYLNQSLVENLIGYKSSAISWLKTHASLPHVNIKSIVISSSSDDLLGQNELPMLLSTVKSIQSVLRSLQLSNELEVSVVFSLSLLENLNQTREKDLNRIFGLMKKIRSFVIVEASIDGELSMGDLLVQSMIKKATIATSLLPYNDVPMVLTIKSPAVPSPTEVAEFTDKVLKSLENNTEIRGQIAELYAELSSMEAFAQAELKREEEQIFPSSRRDLLNNFKTTVHDTTYPPTIFPTTPVSTAPVTIPTDNPTPTIVTVPATNPVTITPNPASTPVPIPSSTPVTVPSTTPGNPPVPITNPVTTPAPPITNPVTTYPAPAGIPVTTPVTNPVAPPATTNAPAIPGQSWCVAKTGTLETALQAALDYACGMGGADCSQIQQGGSCYNPETLQNHASYAFNSYYQKNPVPTSCDFGGAATIVNTNPSAGSCIYLTSSSSLQPSTSTPIPSTTTPTPSTTTATPSTTTATPTPTTTVPSGGTGVSGYGTPPTVLNSSSPASATTNVFGSDSPPGVNTSTSMSTGLKPFIGCIILVTSFISGIIILDM